MSDTSTDTRGRGRPRKFDEEEVLDSLVELFWERGYEDASLNDMVEAAGLNKSSLYNTFGAKDEVFFSAIDRYMDYRQSMIDASFDQDGGLENIYTFIGLVRAESASEGGGRGCMAVNACTELGLREPRATDLAERYRTMLRGAMRPALARAAERDEIDASMVDAYADIVVGFAISVAVAARSGTPADELDRQIDSLEQLVDSWRTTPTHR